MQRIYYLLVFLYISFLGFSQGTGFVTLKGKQFYDQQGNAFFPMVMNYRARIVCDNAANPTGYKIIRDFQNGTTNCLLEPTARYDWANCELSIEDDFEKMKQMGFNTIRLLMAPSRYDNIANDGGFHYDVIQFNNSGTGDADALCAAPKKILNLGPSSVNIYNNSDAHIYFNAVAHALDIAETHGIKIIFFCAEGSGKDNATGLYYPQMGSSESDAEDYAAYLSALAAAVKNKSAIMAYDVFNEPSFSWYLPGRNMNKDKQTVCSYVSQWYDALKTADPNHLVTMGGTGDAMVWDEGIMKLDFVSVHFYPYPNILADSKTASSRQMLRDMVVNQIKWYGNTLQKPWIIGETGFVSSDEPCLIDDLWGDNSDLLSYISDVLPAVISCGGSGFSWWEFQDVHYYCVPDEVCELTCDYCTNWPGWAGDVFDPDGGGYCSVDLDENSPTFGHKTETTIRNAKNNVPGNYFGYLKYGDPDATTGEYPVGLEKESTGYIKNFNPNASYTPPTTPNDYYNPWGFAQTASTITGTVKDENGNPIKDAIVGAKSRVNNLDDDLDFDFNHYTYTKSDGTFQMNLPPSDISTTIFQLRVSSFGAEHIVRDDNSNTPGALYITDGETITMKKFYLDYDAVFNNKTISGVENLQAWNSVSTSNLTINSGAVSELKARTEIHITGESHIKAGSETHIYSAPVFEDCSSYNTYNTDYATLFRKGNPDNSEASASQAIELQFKKKTGVLDFSLQPNPNNGKFVLSIEQNENDIPNAIITVYSILGNQNYSGKVSGLKTEIELKNLATGIYYIRLSTDERSTIKKIIIQ